MAEKVVSIEQRTGRRVWQREIRVRQIALGLLETLSSFCPPMPGGLP